MSKHEYPAACIFVWSNSKYSDHSVILPRLARIVYFKACVNHLQRITWLSKIAMNIVRCLFGDYGRDAVNFKLIIESAKMGNMSCFLSMLHDNPSLVNAVDVDGYSLLHWAAGKVQMFMLAMAVEEDEARAERLRSVHLEMVDVLLAAGANINYRSLIETRFGNRGQTPLGAVLSTGDVAMVELLLNRGAVSNGSSRGGSLVHEFIVATHNRVLSNMNEADVISMIRLLLSYSADVNELDQDYYTVLHLVAIYIPQHRFVLDLLLECGADPNVRVGIHTPVLDALVQAVDANCDLVAFTCLLEADAVYDDADAVTKLTARGYTVAQLPGGKLDKARSLVGYHYRRQQRSLCTEWIRLAKNQSFL